MSTKKKKIFIIKTICFVSIFIVLAFVLFQASKVKPANSTVTNEKVEYLKTFQDVKLIEQELEANPEGLSDIGNELDDEETAILKELGIVEDVIPGFKRYTAKELLTSGFFSTFTTIKEQEEFLDLYGDEEYFINEKTKIIVVKNGREIDGVLTHQRPLEYDDSITYSRLSKPIYEFNKTNEKFTTPYGEEIELSQVSFRSIDNIDGITFRYSYSLNGGEYSEEMEGDSFVITEEGTYEFKVRAVIADENIDDSVEQKFAFTYIYGEEIYEDIIEKSSNTDILSLTITTNTNNSVELFTDEIDQLNNGEIVTKEISEDVTTFTVKATPADTAAVVVGNITYLISGESEKTINLVITAENGDKKTVTLCIKKSEAAEDLYYSSSGYTGGGSGSGSKNEDTKGTDYVQVIGSNGHILPGENGIKPHELGTAKNYSKDSDYHIRECSECDYYILIKHYFDYSTCKIESVDGILSHKHFCNSCGDVLIGKINEFGSNKYKHWSNCELDSCVNCVQSHDWKCSQLSNGDYLFETNCLEKFKCDYWFVIEDEEEALKYKCELCEGHKWKEIYRDSSTITYYCSNCKQTITKKSTEEKPLSKGEFDDIDIKKYF